MKLISNHNRLSHLNVINKFLPKSSEVIICVAFLKNSGLTLLSKKVTGKCTFYIGTDFYITEPLAIKHLIHQGHTVYITKAGKATFHPKIYYFKTGNSIAILTGSANLTGGGIFSNFELSTLLETQTGSSLDKDLKAVFAFYGSHSKLITSELEISQYEREFDLFHKKHKKADKEFKEDLKKIHQIDLSQLSKYFKEYTSDVGSERYKQRIKDYNKIKLLLDQLAKKNISSAKEFLNFYDVIANSFYSSDLLRGKSIFSKKFKLILSVIKFIQENKKGNPKDVYEKARKMILPIERFGVNGLTEIMNTYNPMEFSVANGRTLKSLSDLGFVEFPVSNKKVFTSEIYEDYNSLIKEIGLVCKAKDLGQVDHFLSWYYTNYLEQ